VSDSLKKLLIYSAGLMLPSTAYFASVYFQAPPSPTLAMRTSTAQTPGSRFLYGERQQLTQTKIPDLRGFG